ncbi:MAG: AzlD domain-containing protein [Treponema sp.]|mgnify:FL=1|nr:AzlD domain-containing protein [Treponema sp.]MBP3608215.1 AzlD domain-containing protein [Treponema sp.]MBQ7882189.1 AzlD domain-containing protein [Treponema sp.]
MKLSILQAFIAIFSTAVLMFLLRAFPFILFSKKKPPKILEFIEKYIPPMVIGVLIIYCLSDAKYSTFTSSPWGIPTVAGILFTTVMHLWKNNSMLSIFGGTILYMFLNHIII